MIPQEGEIEIDNQDIKKINLKSLRNKISLVKSQDVILFDDTIRNNCLCRFFSDTKDIEEACKFAAADEFIEKLPQ